MRLVHIYGLVDPLEPEHIRYVGLAKGTNRALTHMRDAYKYKNDFVNTHKLNWCRKLGSERRMYEVVILEQFDEFEIKELGWNEKLWILACKITGHKLTNATIGGEGVFPQLFTPERRAEIGARTKKMWEDPEFKQRHIERMRGNQNLKGTKAAEETKLKQSKAHKGRIQSQDEIQKSANSRRGLQRTPEQRARMSAAQHKRYERIEERVKSMNAAYRRIDANPEYFIDLAAKARAAKFKE